jgi:hypothetical protein
MNKTGILNLFSRIRKTSVLPVSGVHVIFYEDNIYLSSLERSNREHNVVIIKIDIHHFCPKQAAISSYFSYKKMAFTD